MLKLEKLSKDGFDEFLQRILAIKKESDSTVTEVLRRLETQQDAD